MYLRHSLERYNYERQSVPSWLPQELWGTVVGRFIEVLRATVARCWEGHRADGLFGSKVTHGPFNRRCAALSLSAHFSRLYLSPGSYFHSLVMNGLASDTQQTQSLLQSTDNSTVAADITGAGSTAISDSQSSLHDAPSSTDQHSTESNPVTPSPNEPIESALQSIPTNTGTESEGVRSAEVILEEQHKDGTSTGDIAVAESSDLKQEQDLIPVPVNAQIELLEHTPEPAGGEGEAGIVVQEDGQDWMPDSDHELKRVKVSKSSHLV